LGSQPISTRKASRTAALMVDNGMAMGAIDMVAPEQAGMSNGGNGEDLDLRRATLQVEQKRIFVNLRENPRGRYLRIAEVTGNNRSTIIIPSSGLVQFRTLLDDFIQNDSAVALGQQAMLPDSSVPFGLDMGKRKKRGNKADGEPQPSEDDDKRIFVGNLAWSTTGQSLTDHFASCGEIARADVFTERSGRSRGCGIVEFAAALEAKHAIDTMNNTELDGRLIFVREDRG